MPTPEEIAAAEKAAQEAKAKEDAEKAAREAADKGEFKSVDEAKAELQRVRDALKAANSEAADRRKKLKAFEDAETKRQDEEKKRRDAELPEIEKLKKESDERAAKLIDQQVSLQTERARNAFERAVRVKKIEFQNDKAEEDAFNAFSVALEFDDDGKAKDADKALEALLKDRPYLAKVESPKLPPNINALGGNGGRVQDEEARKKELAKRFRIKT